MMLEIILAAILGVLVMILLSLRTLLNAWRQEFSYEHSGLLACIPEISDGVASLVGKDHLPPSFDGDGGKINEIYQQLDTIIVLLQNIEDKK